MKFCNQCGNPINGEKFCTKCGAKVEPDFIPTTPTSPSAVPSAHKKSYKWIAAVAVLVVIVVAVIFIFTGRSYEKTVNSFINATVFDADAEKAMSLMPDELVDYIIDNDYDGDRDKMIDDYEDEYSSALESLEAMGTDLSNASYEIVEAEDATEEEVEEFNEDFRDAGIDIEIKEAKTVEVEMTMDINGNERTNSTNIDVGKIGRSWYIIEM